MQISAVIEKLNLKPHPEGGVAATIAEFVAEFRACGSR